MGELAEVGHPVTEAAGVVGSLAEPAVVQHDQIDAHFGGLCAGEKEKEKEKEKCTKKLIQKEYASSDYASTT